MEQLWTKNICAAEAETIQFLPNNTVLISVNEEHGNLYPLKLDSDNNRILRVRFSDITCPVERHGKKYETLSRDTAALITNFIERNSSSNFIVHCAAGVSRSSAICMYIHIRYGHVLRSRFWLYSEPNPFVLGRLLIEDKRPSRDT